MITTHKIDIKTPTGIIRVVVDGSQLKEGWRVHLSSSQSKKIKKAWKNHPTGTGKGDRFLSLDKKYLIYTQE